MAVHVVIRTAGLSGEGAEVAQRLRDHVVPLVQGRPGFLGYCAFVAEQGDAVCSVGIFEDGVGAAEADARIQEWGNAHLRDLLHSGSEVVRGETVFHEVADPQEQRKEKHHSLFAVIRRYRGLPGQTETMHSVVSAHTLPALTGAEGFRGFYAFRDEADPNQAVSLTLFDNREEAVAVHERIMEIMRAELEEMAYEDPHVIMGETVVLATG